MNLNDLLLILFGALMATAGGVLTELLKIRFEEGRRSDTLKAQLSVAIDKSVKTISALVESYEESKPPLIHGSHVEKLRGTILMYEQPSRDIYLLEKSLRDDIMDFFDRQNSLVSEVGELVSAAEGNGKKEKEIQVEHDRKIAAFRSLKSDGERIFERLQ